MVVVVDLLEGHRLAVDDPLGVRRLGQLGVELDVFPPEDDVIHREGLAVRPLQILAEVEGDGLAVGAELPLRGQAGLHGILWVTRPAQDRIVVQAAIGVEVGRAFPGATPRAAILADLLDGLDDQRISRDALIDGRQLAGLDQLGQHGRFGVLAGGRRRRGGLGRLRSLGGFGGLRRLRGFGRRGGWGLGGLGCRRFGRLRLGGGRRGSGRRWRATRCQDKGQDHQDADERQPHLAVHLSS